MLSTADICVYSDEHSAFNEKSTMNKIMESMALGKPIVQFDLTAGRVSAGEASSYARPDDARDMADKIRELADSPELCRRMGTYGAERARSLSWAVEAPELIELMRVYSLRGLHMHTLSTPLRMTVACGRRRIEPVGRRHQRSLRSRLAAV